MNDKAAPAGPVDPSRQLLRERLPAEWTAGAEEEWRRRTGRVMTAAELQFRLTGIVADQPGEPNESWVVSLDKLLERTIGRAAQVVGSLGRLENAHRAMPSLLVTQV